MSELSSKVESIAAQQIQLPSYVQSPSSSSVFPGEARMIDLDKAYRTPNFHIRNCSDAEKLHGNRNFKPWYRMIQRELKALRLLPFVEAKLAEGVIEISQGKRESLENQAFQQVFAACNRTTANIIDGTDSTFEAMQTLKRLYDTNRIEDIARLDQKYENLRYAPDSSYTREKYVADYKDILMEFEKRGQHFLKDVQVAHFLRKIHGVYDPTSPFFHFYGSITGQYREDIILEYVIEKFLAVSYVQEKSSKNDENNVLFPNGNSSDSLRVKSNLMYKSTNHDKIHSTSNFSSTSAITSWSDNFQLVNPCETPVSDNHSC